MFSDSPLPTLMTIAGTECIGDSLFKINTNTVNISSTLEGFRGDIVDLTTEFNTQVSDSEGVLAQVNELLGSIDNWNSLYSVVQNLSTGSNAAYNLAAAAIPSSSLTSLISGNKAKFTSLTATNFFTPALSLSSIITQHVDSNTALFKSLTATGFIYGNGSKLVGMNSFCRAFIRFRGTGTETNLVHPSFWGSSYNITSVVKNGTGNFTINFASSLSSPYYAYFITSGGTQQYNAIKDPSSNATTYNITVLNLNSAGVPTDPEEMCVQILL